VQWKRWPCAVAVLKSSISFWGSATTYGCICCGIAVAASDLPALYASKYYRQREGFGRLFDSDVLTTSGTLFGGVSVADIPQQVLDASVDFGQ